MLHNYKNEERQIKQQVKGEDDDLKHMEVL